MKISYYREEHVYFRIVGLASDLLTTLQQRLDGVHVEHRQRNGKSDFVLSVELSTPAVCDIVRRAVSSLSLKEPYGLYVSLVTERDSDGVRLEPFICKFWKAVGGNLDFSFTVVDLERKAKRKKVRLRKSKKSGLRSNKKK